MIICCTLRDNQQQLLRGHMYCCQAALCLARLEVDWGATRPRPTRPALAETCSHTGRCRFTHGRPDVQLLCDYCHTKFGWPLDKTGELLQPVLKASLPCCCTGGRVCDWPMMPATPAVPGRACKQEVS